MKKYFFYDITVDMSTVFREYIFLSVIKFNNLYYNEIYKMTKDGKLI